MNHHGRFSNAEIISLTSEKTLGTVSLDLHFHYQQHHVAALHGKHVLVKHRKKTVVGGQERMISCPLAGHLGQELMQKILTPATGHRGLQQKENKA